MGSAAPAVRSGTSNSAATPAEYFRAKIQAPWFAYWLKGKGELPLQEAATFETGSNEWKQWDAWPPRESVEQRQLIFPGERALSFDPPSAEESAQPTRRREGDVR